MARKPCGSGCCRCPLCSSSSPSSSSPPCCKGTKGLLLLQLLPHHYLHPPQYNPNLSRAILYCHCHFTARSALHSQQPHQSETPRLCILTSPLHIASSANFRAHVPHYSSSLQTLLLSLSATDRKWKISPQPRVSMAACFPSIKGRQ